MRGTCDKTHIDRHRPVALRFDNTDQLRFVLIRAANQKRAFCPTSLANQRVETEPLSSVKLVIYLSFGQDKVRLYPGEDDSSFYPVGTTVIDFDKKRTFNVARPLN